MEEKKEKRNFIPEGYQNSTQTPEDRGKLESLILLGEEHLDVQAIANKVRSLRLNFETSKKLFEGAIESWKGSISMINEDQEILRSLSEAIQEDQREFFFDIKLEEEGQEKEGFKLRSSDFLSLIQSQISLKSIKIEELLKNWELSENPKFDEFNEFFLAKIEENIEFEIEKKIFLVIKNCLQAETKEEVLSLVRLFFDEGFMEMVDSSNTVESNSNLGSNSLQREEQLARGIEKMNLILKGFLSELPELYLFGLFEKYQGKRNSMFGIFNYLSNLLLKKPGDHGLSVLAIKNVSFDDSSSIDEETQRLSPSQTRLVTEIVGFNLTALQKQKQVTLSLENFLGIPHSVNNLEDDVTSSQQASQNQRVGYDVLSENSSNSNAQNPLNKEAYFEYREGGGRLLSFIRDNHLNKLRNYLSGMEAVPGHQS